MARMFSAIYGAEYLEERLKCIERLRQLHLRFPRKYPLGFVRNAWATLNVRWVHDLKAMTDTLRLYAKVGRPTSQQLQAVGMTVVNSSGTTLFRRPDTFGMEGPTSYFVSEIMRKLNGDKELQDWTSYHTPSTRNTSRVSGPPGGLDTPDAAGFTGPNLTPAERRWKARHHLSTQLAQSCDGISIPSSDVLNPSAPGRTNMSKTSTLRPRR